MYNYIIVSLTESLGEVGEDFKPERLAKFDDIIVMSAHRKNNIELVKTRIREIMDDYAERRLKEELRKQSSLRRQEETESAGFG